MSGQASDFLYRNAPLIEVIAELHWELVQLTALPGAAVDPNFRTVAPQLESVLRENGFTFVSQIQPPQIPDELLSYRPRIQYRKSHGLWPVYQHGPGIFTCNMVPPYQGWSEFRNILERGLRLFFQASGQSSETLKFTKCELRYIDGFTGKHGLNDAWSFIENELGISLKLRDEFKQFSDEDRSPSSKIEVMLPIEGGASLALMVAPGRTNGEPAVILDIKFTQNMSGANMLPEALIERFDKAHDHLRRAFQILTSETLKERMGPKDPIKE